MKINVYEDMICEAIIEEKGISKKKKYRERFEYS